MSNLDVREKRGIMICIIGLACNLLLSAGKIAAGWIFGFVSVTADGFNNVSDCGSGIVALVSFFIAAKPADRQHPFGHRRAEYIASMIAGFFVMLLSAELFRSSVGSIMEGETAEAGNILYLILAGSVAVKAGMAVLYHIFAKKLGYGTLRAAAVDCFSDCIATLAVILGTALARFFPAADGCGGIVVSLFIAFEGIKIIAEASSELLGQADPALAARLKEMALKKENVLGIHDLRIYSYGKGAVFATLHVEMDASLDMLAAHAVIDELELQARRETGVGLTVHLDPVDLTNREESSLRIVVTERVQSLADGLKVHDFRLTGSRVEFDVGVPYRCKRTDAELSAALSAIVKECGPYETVINIERE